MARDTKKIEAALKQYLPLGDQITGIRTLSAGHSNETYVIEGLNRILRMPPSEEGLLPPYDMKFQYDVMSAVKQHAPTIPMPEMYELCLDKSIAGDEFFIMECLPGEAFEYTVPDWVNENPDVIADSICRQWFGALTALHNLSPDLLACCTTRTVAEEIDHWLQLAERCEADPRLLDTLRTLSRNPPATSGVPAPVHGDPKHGNFMWHQGKLSAVLDWEMTQISEPLLDLGYILMFHNQGEASLANAGFELPTWWSREKMIDEWQQATGRVARDIEKYEVLGQAKVAAIISLGAYLYRIGRVKDPRFEAWETLLPSYLALLQQRAEQM